MMEFVGIKQLPDEQAPICGGFFIVFITLSSRKSTHYVLEGKMSTSCTRIRIKTELLAELH